METKSNEYQAMETVQNVEVFHVRRPSATSSRRRRRSPIKAVRQGVLVVSVILFASGLLTTVTSSTLSFVSFHIRFTVVAIVEFMLRNKTYSTL